MFCIHWKRHRRKKKSIYHDHKKMEKIDEIVQPAADAFHFVNRRIEKKGIFLNLKIKFEGKF